MTRNYECPKVDAHWSTSRETHEAVAAAIHAIASGSRTAEVIWDSPTRDEWDHVHMAVEEYLRHGNFKPEPDDHYAWGWEPIHVPAPR